MANQNINTIQGISCNRLPVELFRAVHVVNYYCAGALEVFSETTKPAKNGYNRLARGDPIKVK
jgi:hypothetical protein